MFPRLYSSFNSGPKLPLTKVWLDSPKCPIRTTKSPKFQNVSSSFVIPKVLPKIFDAIDVNFDEVLPKIPNFIVANLDEIVELSDSQSDPQVDPLEKKHNFGVVGIRNKPRKKSYDNSIKFHAKWAIKLPWLEGLVVIDGIIQIMRCKVCSLIENKDKIVKCKWDILTKHVSYRIIIRDLLQLGVKKGGEYIAKDCAHLRIM
jgi:hypothetical protein